jgi:hypothetical protein
LHYACIFTFCQTEGTFIICYFEYDNANKNKLMIMFILFFVYEFFLIICCAYEGFFLHNLHPEFIISERT